MGDLWAIFPAFPPRVVEMVSGKLAIFAGAVCLSASAEPSRILLHLDWIWKLLNCDFELV